MPTNEITRRDLITRAIAVGALVPAAGLLASNTQAAEATLLDSNDPVAKALGYTPDASKVDTKANPAFKPGQMCGSCAQFQGKSGDTSATCAIFAGRSVPAGGWCGAWTQRSGQ